MLSKRGFVLSKKQLSDLQIQKLKQDLYVKPENFGTQNFTQADYFHVYRESKNHYRVPRFYGSNMFPKFQEDFSYTSINVPFNGTLKDSLNQNIAVDKCVNALKLNGGGILSLPTGYGKTTCSLAVLSKLGVKTLIIVHKEFLMNQWKERISQFLPNATIGIIRQSKIETNNDIVIAMLQTLCTKDFPNNTFDSFGLTIIDETHHICSRVFSKSMFLITTKYILGLSATPERKDRLTYVLHWFLGPICYSVHRENQANVVVNQIEYDCELYNSPVPVNSANKTNLPELINQIVAIEERNKCIIKIIKTCLEEKRNIILLTERRSHCENLMKMLKLEVKENVSMGLYMGGMKQQVLKENEACDVLFATYSLAHEGLDIPRLNTLILATPKGDVVQSCGRILRETGVKKHYPLIYDIIDNWGPCVGQSKRRKTFYNKSGFEIQNSKSENESITKFNNCAFIDE